MKKFLTVLSFVFLVLLSYESFAQRLRVMPLGDSITGWTGRRIYREWLWDSFKKAKLKVNFVGSMKDRSNKSGFDRDHEGHSGWTSSQINSKIRNWAKKYNPDLVLIHLGSNDLRAHRNNSEKGVGQVLKSLRSIVRKLREANPEVKILLAQILPGTDRWYNPADVPKVNREIALFVERLHTAQSPIHLVDMNTGFSTSKDLRDGLHPNSQGAKKMAERWLVAMQKILNRGDPVEPPSEELEISHFSLVDGMSEETLAGYEKLPNGITIDLSQFQDYPHLNMEAHVPVSDFGGSVKMQLPDGSSRTENSSIYTVFRGDALTQDNFSLGSHVLEATPYSEKNLGGEAGEALSLRFRVVESDREEELPPPMGAQPHVLHLALFDEESREDIAGYEKMPLNSVIDLSALPRTQGINIRIVTDPIEIGSARFRLDGGQVDRIENSPPYTLFEEGGDLRFQLSTGPHRLKIQAFEKRGGKGGVGQSRSFSLRVQ